MIRTVILFGLAMFAIGTSVNSLRADDVAKKREFFESRIRPVLIKHCYKCHSASSKEIKGSLRLDSAVGVLKGGDSGPSIVPGKPDKSPLIEALRYEGVEMPPAGRLPAKVVGDFERWVAMGAFDPRTDVPNIVTTKKPRVIDIEAGRKFWAFQPVRRHKRPTVSDSSWPESIIDAFVLAKLEDAQLKPAVDADRATMIRRLYFDLIGLPPSPAAVRAFLKDDSDIALEQLADRLLESKQFGVQWGRHWLDVARYADSNGGDFNATFHHAWKYRDYVIDSFNRDKSFDQMVREQIAGDLLVEQASSLADNSQPKNTQTGSRNRREQIVATGFLMIGTKMLSERDKRKLAMDVVDEQINTIGQAFMGLTLGCARCHDHKFDPIPTRDYYALAGIFSSTETLKGESQQYVSTWPRRNLPAADEHVAAVKKYETSKKELQASIKKTTRRKAKLVKQLETMRTSQGVLTFDDADAKLIGNWKSSTNFPAFVGKGYIHDNKSEKGEKFVEFTATVPHTAVYDVQLSYTPGPSRAASVPISVKHADSESEVTLDQRKKPPIDKLFASVGRFRFSTERPGIITIATRGTQGFVIVDAVRLVQLDENGKPANFPDELPSKGMTKLRADVEQATEKEKELKGVLKTLDEAAPKPLPKAIAVAEADKIGDCEICIRGEHENLGPVVPRGVLQVVAGDHSKPFGARQSGRLELANWIANSNHPLTARVYVNRIWHHLIGRGIVASVDNFGWLGDRPTHPELLDQLAADFISDGWSTKGLIRRIVLSHVYRLSSQHHEPSWNADPENRLLWRAHRRRLPAESIRDSILAVSGKLDLSPGGSPVEGLGTLVTQNSSEQKKFDRTESLRRSAYLPIIRSEIPAILSVFDFADPDLVTGRRAVTNVPAQALLLLNSPFVMEQSQKAADRVFETADNARGRIIRTYELVLSRRPTELEIARAKAFLKSAQQPESKSTPLAQLIHTLIASIEFRMLD